MAMTIRRGRRRLTALPALALLVAGAMVGVVAAQKPPAALPEAVEALMHCAPWRPEYTPDPAIPPPTEMRAERDADPSRVRLTWRDNAENETCYGILHVLPPPVQPSSQEQITVIIVALPNATAATVLARTDGPACFAVYAGNAAGRSVPSDLACADTPAGADPTPMPIPRGASGGLSVDNRETLAICVHGTGDAMAAVPDARRRVERALAVVSQHRHFLPAGFGVAAPVVDEGCPHEPYLLQPDVYWEDGIPITGAGRTVQDASIYRLFVFLLPPDELARVIHGRHNTRRTAEEMLCQGHGCREVTTGLYLTPDETADEPFLAEWILKGLGLEAVMPLVSPLDVPRGR